MNRDEASKGILLCQTKILRAGIVMPIGCVNPRRFNEVGLCLR